jgi:hypothetical protein
VSSYDVLRHLLSDHPIAFHPALARAFGGINEALRFQQLASWSDKGADPEWIFKTRVELEEETYLSAYQQKQARDRLKRLGVLEDERRGVPARLYYRILWDVTCRLLETANPDSEQPAGKDARNSATISQNRQRAQPKRNFEGSNGPTFLEAIDDDWLTRLAYAEDLAREMGDQSPLSSPTMRLVNLCRGADVDLDTFDTLMQARRITQQRTPAIHAPRPDGPGPRPKIAYMLAVLEDLLGRMLPATGPQMSKPARSVP